MNANALITAAPTTPALDGDTLSRMRSMIDKGEGGAGEFTARTRLVAIRTMDDMAITAPGELALIITAAGAFGRQALAGAVSTLVTYANLC